MAANMSSAQSKSTQQQAAGQLPLGNLLEISTRQWQGHIQNFTQYSECVTQYTLHNKVERDQEEGGVDDFPRTPEARLDYVRVLFQAMVDFSHPIEEVEGRKPSFQMERVKNLSDVEIEILAWDLQISLENAHRGYHGFAANSSDWEYRAYGSFGARHRAAMDACRESKSIVYNLAASKFVRKLAGHPDGAIKRKKENNKINGSRAEQKRKGKEALTMLATVTGDPAYLNNAATSSGTAKKTTKRERNQNQKKVKHGRVTKGAKK